MYPTNTLYRGIARVLLVLFLSNTLSPTLHFTFADSTQYYVDAVSGNDSNDGLSPATAWQTLAKVNGTPFLQGDTVSLLCSESWAESLNLNALPGSPGLPITINSYGSCPSDSPTIEGINITNSNYVIVDGIDVSDNIVGSIVSINTSGNITLQYSTIAGSNGLCTDVIASSGVIIDNNTLTNCQNAMSISGSEAAITNNTMTAITGNGVEVSSALPVDVSYNTFLNIAESAILFGADTDVLRNSITTVCTTGATECAAIRNSSTTLGVTTSTVTENSIKDVGTGVSSLANAGVMTRGVSDVSILKNGIINAQYAVRVVDTANTSISQNTLLSSRVNSLSVIQNNTGATSGNSFTGNTFLQRAPDYPYIELRDEVPGNGVVSGFMSFDANNIYPNYKPNSSYARTVKFGGETVEYTKAELTALDPNITKFQYFAYKPYVNTGSYATANQLTNGDFASDVTNWTPSALSGSAPSITHNPTGSHIGGSANVSPAGGSADRIWVTNDAVLSITSGQVFHVTGYAKSSSGTINLRAFLHSSLDKTVVYSDRIAETYANSTGGTFSFYLTATSTAADAQLTLETSNNDVVYEIDEVSFRRLAAHVKNTNTFEVLAYQNPTASVGSQSCPGGAACTAYVDGINSSINWPISLPAYATSFVLWNGGPNILNPATCNINLSAGSVPSGETASFTWVATGSYTQVINYSEEFTGAISEAVGSTGSRTFTPPYIYVNNSDIFLELTNDVGPSSCLVSITTENTAPKIYPVTITGSEDDLVINATLSGVDNPGDTITFYKTSDPVHGVINVDSTGSMQYYPYPDFCGVDSFNFRADDDKNKTADPAVVQPITIACLNDAPFAVNDSGSTNGPMISLDILANDTDVDTPYEVQTFSIASFSQPLSGSVVQNGNNLEYTPIGTFSGADTFVYRMQDQSGALSTSTGIVTIHVVLPNMAPQTYNMNLTTNEDIVINDVLSGSDINGDILSFTALTLPSSGSLNLLPNGTFSYTPQANIYGSDTFDFIATDGMLNSNTGTVTITINSILDAPTGVADSYSLNQDTNISIPVLLNDYDVDSTIITLTGITNPSHGTATLSGTTIYYVPNIGYSGPDSFTYQIEDDTSLLSSPVTVNLNVVFTNATPSANPGSFSVNEDITLTGSATGSDPELSTLIYTLDSTTTNGSLTFSSTGGFRYIPNANFNGSDSFSFHVSDGVLTSTSATIDITINPVNDVPTASTTTLTAMGNSIVSNGHVSTGVLSGNDIDGNPLTFTAATLPVHGLLSMTSTGYITYTPAMGYIGSDSFTFRVNDGVANSAPVAVNINVTSNGVPIPLGYFSVITPSTVNSGSSFSVTVQARDLLGNIMTNYTGSIVFTGSDPLAILPASGASIAFNLTDAGVKTFSNATTLYTIGTSNLRVQDSITSASGSSNILVNLFTTTLIGPGGATIVSLPPGYTIDGTGTFFTSYASAPIREPETRFQFVGENSDLMNTLMLVNRIILPDGTLTHSESGELPDTSYTNPAIPGVELPAPEHGTTTYLMHLSESALGEYSGSLLLRAAFWDHIHRAEMNSSEEASYATARAKLNGLNFTDNERLDLVREVLLRILDSYERRHREMVERNTAVYSPSSKSESGEDSDTNSDTDTIELDILDDTTPNLDLSETDLSGIDLSGIDLSEIDLTEEELALLQQ